MAQLNVVSDNTGLVAYTAMCSAITACHRVDEVKDIHDKTIALKQYHKIAKNKEPERMCREIQLRAERRIGELTKELPKAKTRYAYSPVSDRKIIETKSETINRLNISTKAVSDYERIASIPKKEFEAEVKKPNASTRRLSDYAKSKEPPKVNPEKLKPKWHDKHLEAQVRLDGGLETIVQGLKLVIRGLIAKDAILAVMAEQDTNLPSRSVKHRLDTIKKQMESLRFFWEPFCKLQCPLRKSANTNVPVLLTHEETQQ